MKNEKKLKEVSLLVLPTEKGLIKLREAAQNKNHLLRETIIHFGQKIRGLVNQICS